MGKSACIKNNLLKNDADLTVGTVGFNIKIFDSIYFFK